MHSPLSFLLLFVLPGGKPPQPPQQEKALTLVDELKSAKSLKEKIEIGAQLQQALLLIKSPPLKVTLLKKLKEKLDDRELARHITPMLGVLTKGPLINYQAPWCHEVIELIQEHARKRAANPVPYPACYPVVLYLPNYIIYMYDQKLAVAGYLRKSMKALKRRPLPDDLVLLVGKYYYPYQTRDPVWDCYLAGLNNQRPPKDHFKCFVQQAELRVSRLYAYMPAPYRSRYRDFYVDRAKEASNKGAVELLNSLHKSTLGIIVRKQSTVDFCPASRITLSLPTVQRSASSVL